MEQIITNEIYKLIGRNPDEYELESAIKYLDGCADDLTTPEQIHDFLTDWRSDCMVRCECCGKWGLRDEMIHKDFCFFCDEKCEHEYDEYTYDMSQLERDEYKFNVLNA